jgi:hypothetical protein
MNEHFLDLGQKNRIVPGCNYFTTLAGYQENSNQRNDARQCFTYSRIIKTGRITGN